MNKDFINFRNRLKMVPRTGWIQLGVPTENVESVYDHIASTKDLIQDYNKEYDLQLDINRINEMITIKELTKAYNEKEKSVIDTDKNESSNRSIILDIMKKFNLDNSFIELYDEFENGQTNEAKYALMFSKFESDLQAVDYYEQGLITLEAVYKDIEFYPEELKNEVKDLLEQYPVAPLAWLTYNSKYYKDNELLTNLSNELKSYCINKYSNNQDFKRR